MVAILGIFVWTAIAHLLPRNWDVGVSDLAAVGWYGIAGICFVSGVWLLASPDPRETLRSRGRTIRRLCRAGPPAMLAIGALWMAGPRWLGRSNVVLLLIAWCVFLIWILLASLHINRLAERIPSRGMHRRARIVVMALVVALIAHVGLACFLILSSWVSGLLQRIGRTPKGATAIGWLNAIGYVALVVGGLATILMLVAMVSLVDMCYREFRKASDRAALNWSIADHRLESSNDTS
jgi:hypothetical protein